MYTLTIYLCPNYLPSSLYIYLYLHIIHICNLFRGSPDTDDQTIVTPGNFESHIGKYI